MIKVSVIIPTYNRPESLQVAVQSVLDQGVVDVEVIIIDDASNESHIPAIEEVALLSKEITLFSRQENHGVSSCRNLGLKEAKGEFVVFLDDDDVLLAGMLERSIAAIERANADIVSCRSAVKGSQITKNKLKRYNAQQQDELDLYDMENSPAEHIFLYAPQIHTFLFRKKSIIDVKFVEQLNYGEDMVFWMKLAEKGLIFKKLDFVGVVYNLNPSSASSKEPVESKIRFYNYLLRNLKLSNQTKNLVYIKLSYLSFSQRRWSVIKWFIKSLTRPNLLIKHVRFYFKSL
ncbi:MAG: glycosyltransferase family 2 protein [Reichenbachiella sp.]|uniref:glycosyltransferase family 2 protein n=1 Tax=Reichenbachiella sp. TaxID=2184521 RepID=UPI003296D1E7